MNILQKIVYFFLEKQEKTLTKRLSRHLKTSSSNSTSKTVVSKGVTMTLNAETEKNKDLKPFKIQIFASISTVITALLILYVVFYNWDNNSLSDIENPIF